MLPKVTVHVGEAKNVLTRFRTGWFTLAVIDGALKIKLKRVDIVNCDAAFGNIQLFM